MKNRPLKHKESNTFRFLPFAERIAAIEVDVFHHVDRRRGVEGEGETQTFLYLTLEKWNALNCTDSFSEFRHNFVKAVEIETLPQLVLHSKDVAKSLLWGLKTSNYHSLQPILECVVALAKDLRHDFYQYFPAFLIRIVNILTAPIPPEGRGQREAEIAEWCLSCLAHLCKLLWRSMLKDWQYVYGSVLLPVILVERSTKTKHKYSGDTSAVDTTARDPVICTNDFPGEIGVDASINNVKHGGHGEMDANDINESDNQPTNNIAGCASASKDPQSQLPKSRPVQRENVLRRPPPEFVRDFVVQSFAFVARKAKDKSSFLESVIATLKDDASGIVGTGLLLAEVMKGVQGHFHSCSESLFPLLLQIGCKTSEDPDYFGGPAGVLLQEEEKSIVFQLVNQVLIAVMSLIKPEKEAWFFWKVLLDMAQKCTSEYKASKDVKQQISLQRSLSFLHLAVTFNQGQWLVSDIKQGISPVIQSGNLLPLPNQLANLVTSIFHIPTLDERIALDVSGLVSSVLCSEAVAQGKFRLEQDIAAKLCNQVLMYHHAEVVFKFVRGTTNFAGFETLILPHLMSFCCGYHPALSDDCQVNPEKEVLDLLACLILAKAPPCPSGGTDLLRWQQYPLDFKITSGKRESSDVSCFPNFVKETLCVPMKKKYSQFDSYVSVLIILPHLRGISGMSQLLIESVNSLFQLLGGDNSSQSLKLENVLFVLSEAIIAAVLAKDDGGSISRNISCNDVLHYLLPHAKVANRIPTLRALDVYFTHAMQNEHKGCAYVEESTAVLDQIYGTLSVNLSSPYREVRSLTLHMLSELEKDICKESSSGIFCACFAAEMVPLTIHDFREKVGLLEALKAASDTKVASFSSLQAVVKYLLGVHFANFKLLWEPTCKMIASHAHTDTKSFWEVFVHQLKLAMAYVRVDSRCKLLSNELILAAEMAKRWERHDRGSFLSNCEYLAEWYTKRFILCDTPDFVNYRIQLIKTMCEMTEICEARNRDISEIFLSFYEEEFMKSDANISPTWDIRKAESDEADAEMDESDEEAGEAETNDSKGQKYRFSCRLSTKTMVDFLKLLSKMRNPKAMHKEPELAKVYGELICHHNTEIQQQSLDCLLTYRCKSIAVYRENLLGLIDETKFKSEMNLFKIDKESELVKEEHRSQLMPLLMKILYSKMKSGNKRTGHQRRALILRFIAGCHDKEIAMFLRMAFNLLISYCEDTSEDAANMVRRLMSSINLEKAVHPKRLLSTSNLLVVVVERLGSLLLPVNSAEDISVSSEALGFLLHCLLCTNALIVGEYVKKDLIHPCHLTTLRSARAAALATVATFFRRLDHYPWSVTSCHNGMLLGDLEALFEVTIWPWLDQLPVEGIHSPSALLKLIIVWSENPRYHPLLAKKRMSPQGQYDSVIPAVMCLLGGKKTRPSVVNAILDMVEVLITYASEEETGIAMEVAEEQAALLGDLPPLSVGPMIEMPEGNASNIHVSQKLNLGSKLILPHIPCILQVLTRRFRSLKKGGSPSARDLRVLSQLSELVWEPVDSEALVTLILPVATRKASVGATGEQMCQLLITANHLLRNVADSWKFLRAIAPLFSTVDGRAARTILCQILDTVASKHEYTEASCEEIESAEDDIKRVFLQEDLRSAARILKSLNSWDPKKLEEPDYARRLDTYKELKQMRENQIEGETKFPLVLGILLIHNSFHAVRNEKDLSLRESAANCLQTLSPVLAISSSTSDLSRNLVLGETLLTLISKALKDRKAPEAFHYDVIGTLGAMVHQCSTLHPMLKDLSRLASQDVETDFFENIKHLQLHRRGRALMRFVQDAKEDKKPMGPQTLTNIILPLSFQFLLNVRYAKNNSLVDSAIEAVGAACHCLPWHHYQAILKHQLGRLQRGTIEFGRQPIRLVVAILNNFHFNLSLADDDDDDEMGKFSATGEGEAVAEKEEVTYLNPTTVSVWSQDLLLPASAARRARRALSTVLLPQLHGILIAPTERDSSHKLNRRAGGAVGTEVTGKEAKDGGTKGEEETLVMRVPIALAAVKMLQRLPSDFMDHHLTSVLLKVLAFLKCRLESVRRAARETLVEIAVSLGPMYLPTVVRETSSLLLPVRGYAFHVLAFTAHSLLVSIVPLMGLGDMDKCLRDFVEICKADLFGITSEEKEVTRITAKVYEARSHKSYDSFYLIAKVVSESCLIDLVHPLKEVLDQTHSFKVIKITKDCLSRITKGLLENRFLSPASLLVFSYGLLSKSITALWPTAPIQPEKPLARRSAGVYAGISGRASLPLELPPDPFLIPREPRKARSKVSGTVSKVGAQANAHAMMEFGLHLLHLLLKKEQIRWKKGVGVGVALAQLATKEQGEEVKVGQDADQLTVDIAMLDPLVPIVCECLESKYPKLTTLALNCFRLMLRMDLPSMKDHIVKSTSSVYSMLHKFAGATSGDNYNLAVAAFKTVAVLVRNVRTLPVEQDHLSALLTYVSRDLDLGGEVGMRLGGYGPARTATAFGVLRSVIARRLRSPIIPSLMKRVAKLSISAQALHIQAQSRQVFLQFLMDYPMKKNKLEQNVAFYLGQLNYELLSGRESALEFLHSMVASFPNGEIKKHSEILFVSLGARLVDEEVPDCRRKVAAVIKSLLTRLNHQSQNQLFDIVVIWMQDSEVSHQQLGFQLCGLFVMAEGEAFSSRLNMLFPLISSHVHVSQYKKTETGEGDAHTFQLIQLILKIFMTCPETLSKPQWREYINNIAILAQSLLGHPHEWIRLASCQVLGVVLGSVDPSDIASAAKEEISAKKLSERKKKKHTVETESVVGLPFLFVGVNDRIKSLTLDLCAQLHSEEIGLKLAEQVIKNLVFLARVLKNTEKADGTFGMQCPSADSKGQLGALTLSWLIHKMRNIVNSEVTQAPNHTVLRSAVFKWLAAIALDLSSDPDHLQSHIHQILGPVIREVDNKATQGDEPRSKEMKELRRLAYEVCELIKEKVGLETYACAVRDIQKRLTVRRAERKRIMAQEVINMPEKAAKRKIKKQLVKKQMKKRKITIIKGQKLK